MSAPKRRIAAKSNASYPSLDRAVVQERRRWKWVNVGSFYTEDDGVQAAIDYLEELKRIDRANGAIK